MIGVTESEGGADGADRVGRCNEEVPAPSTRGSGRESNKGGGEEARRRRGERRRSGFDDGIERAYCLLRGHVPPPDFPIQHRHGVATRRLEVVARRPAALLLCDLDHEGPHRWPDGEPASATDGPGG